MCKTIRKGSTKKLKLGTKLNGSTGFQVSIFSEGIDECVHEKRNKQKSSFKSIDNSERDFWQRCGKSV